MKTKALLFSLATLLAFSTLAQTGDSVPSSGATHGEITIGGAPAVDLEDSGEAVAEYEPTAGGVLVDAKLGMFSENGSYQLKLDSFGGQRQNHAFAFDVKRVVRSITTFDKLPHNLGHDSMANLEAATPAGRQIWHTDAAPTANYGYKFANLAHRTEFQAGSNVTLAANFRNQTRDGHSQTYTISHCEGCHVQSQARPVDETTRTAGLEAAFAWASGLVRGSFDRVKLTEGTQYVLNQYDRAVHPELRTPVFDNRISFGIGEGPLPMDLRPDIDKSVMKVDVALPNVAGFALNGGGVWSETENQYTGLKASYAGYSLSAARTISDWRVLWRGRAYSLENDDIFIDIVEPLGKAGAQAGKTYREIYGFDPDWLRQSSLDRSVIDSRFEVGRKLGRKGGNLRLIWDYNATDRDHYEVAVGETETTKNVFAVAWNNRFAKKLRVDARLAHGMVDNPFMYIDGSCSTLTSTSVPNPFDPRGAQYFQHHASRVGDTTSSPEDWQEARLAATYAMGRSSLSANTRYWKGENTAGDLTDWSRDSLSASVTYAFTPTPRANVYASASWFNTEIDAPVCIPLFDG